MGGKLGKTENLKVENFATNSEKLQMEFDAANKHFKAVKIKISWTSNTCLTFRYDDSESWVLKGESLTIEHFKYKDKKVTLPVVTFSPIN